MSILSLLTPVITQIFPGSVGYIVRPAPALKTGLIPERWTVRRDEPEGFVYLDGLDFSTSPVLGDGYSVNAETMLRLGKHAYGSLGLVYEMQIAQELGRNIFPVELRRYYLLAPRTILADAKEHLYIAGLNWGQTDGKEGLWLPAWFPLDELFYAEARFIRPREPGL